MSFLKSLISSVFVERVVLLLKEREKCWVNIKYITLWKSVRPTTDVSSPMTVTVVQAHNFGPGKENASQLSWERGYSHGYHICHLGVCVTLKSLLNTVERPKSCNRNISAPVERCNICNCNISAPPCSTLHNCWSTYEIQTSFCLSTLCRISLAIGWKRELPVMTRSLVCTSL